MTRGQQGTPLSPPRQRELWAEQPRRTGLARPARARSVGPAQTLPQDGVRRSSGKFWMLVAISATSHPGPPPRCEQTRSVRQFWRQITGPCGGPHRGCLCHRKRAIDPLTQGPGVPPEGSGNSRGLLLSHTWAECRPLKRECPLRDRNAAGPNPVTLTRSGVPGGGAETMSPVAGRPSCCPGPLKPRALRFLLLRGPGHCPLSEAGTGPSKLRRRKTTNEWPPHPRSRGSRPVTTPLVRQNLG